MRSARSTLILGAGASLALAHSSSPCGQITELKAGQTKGSFDVPALVAMECLRSVPININAAEILVEDIKTYAEFQSNLADLKNPPEGYWNSQVDILGGLDSIKESISGGEYDSEFALQYDLWDLIRLGFDSHFTWNPDIMSVFKFRRQFMLYSVSRDGFEVPKIYSDTNMDPTVIPSFEGQSEVVLINGYDVQEYLADLAAESPGCHTPDCRYNNLFVNSISVAQGLTTVSAMGRFVTTDPETSTNITWANGDWENLDDYAVVSAEEWDDSIANGQDFYDHFCESDAITHEQEPDTVDAALPVGRSLKEKRQTETETLTQLVNYPVPKMIHSQRGMLSGYYLDDADWSDVAVLSMITFSAAPKGWSEYQILLENFLKDAKADGKTKLILDMRGNNGGSVTLGFDIMKQLFPSVDPWSGSRYRANEGRNAIGQIQAAAYEAGEITDMAGPWAYYNYTNVDGHNFKSWEEFFGPHHINGGDVTSFRQYDTAKLQEDPSFSISGYGARADVSQEQPFESQNMLMIHDGNCHSLCHTLSSRLKIQGGVKQIAFGGAPELRPMQGVGGTKGGEIRRSDFLRDTAKESLELAPAEDRAVLQEGVLGKIINATTVLQRSSDGKGISVNSVDMIRPYDIEGLRPAQFEYEASDCRLFYTEKALQDVREVWRMAAKSLWDYGGCVKNSASHPSSLSGGWTATEGAAQDGVRNNAHEAVLQHNQVQSLSTPEKPKSAGTSLTTSSGMLIMSLAAVMLML